MNKKLISMEESKAENAHLKRMLSNTDMFLNAVIHLSMENWEPALKARIESLTRENKQHDDAYANIRALLDKELADLRAKNMELEKEADWLARELRCRCHNYGCDKCGWEICPVRDVKVRKEWGQLDWRGAARRVISEKE